MQIEHIYLIFITGFLHINLQKKPIILLVLGLSGLQRR